MPVCPECGNELYKSQWEAAHYKGKKKCNYCFAWKQELGRREGIERMKARTDYSSQKSSLAAMIKMGDQLQKYIIREQNKTTRKAIAED